MKIVIIEDEEYAARRLENMIREYDSKIVVAAKLESVSESIAWFKANEEPDLIFLDINLEDDLSFAIFKEVAICCPIVFTTASDELAARAFSIRGIDYLLKPILQTDLHEMINKYKNQPKSQTPVNPAVFNEIINPNKP